MIALKWYKFFFKFNKHETLTVSFRRTNFRHDPVSVSTSAAVASCHGLVSCSVRPHHYGVRFLINRRRYGVSQFRRFTQKSIGKLLHLPQRLQVKSQRFYARPHSIMKVRTVCPFVCNNHVLCQNG